ncbi:hypothetical protein O6H91_13G099900 [Diphasiastrum complanatum]|uniref:Uncharacterized protein n=1 Tax=Diphasiastrum complanatum TaxID=34168 RepID=A0ACC2BXS9_DIPCM|nr:hypothetical protein O6H91_13G099900 [Diphasiastrum complanatum]
MLPTVAYSRRRLCEKRIPALQIQGCAKGRLATVVEGCVRIELSKNLKHKSLKQNGWLIFKSGCPLYKHKSLKQNGWLVFKSGCPLYKHKSLDPHKSLNSR